MLKATILGLVLVGVSGFADADDRARELQKLQGVWTMVSMRSPQMELKDARALNKQVQVQSNEWTEVEFGTPGIRSRIELGTDGNVQTINLTSQYVGEEGVQVEVIRGIYQIDGNTLMVATASVNNRDRPQRFVFENPVNVLAVYKRAK